MPLVFASRMRRDGAAPLIGSSAVMRAVRDRIERVAATDFITLIDGESGTGKELVARQIHEISARRRGPFVPVNCAAIVETLLEAELFGIEDRTATGVRGRRGKFECANGGTLFLDEVADLSLSAQAKLLRALQDLAVERVGGNGLHRVNTRVVAATNKKLCGLVEARLFRADLFYRLAGIEIHVPPLRERREDILELASYFLERHGQTRQLTLSRAAADALLTYDWPGNVRELERMMERTLALARHATIEVGRPPDPHPRRLWRRAAAVDDAQRHAAGVGKPLRQARPRAKRAQQAQGVPRARHQLSHAAGVSAICAPAAGGERARNITGLFGRELGRTHSAQRDRRKRGTAGAVWGHAHVQFISPKRARQVPARRGGRQEDVCLGPHR